MASYNTMFGSTIPNQRQLSPTQVAVNSYNPQQSNASKPVLPMTPAGKPFVSADPLLNMAPTPTSAQGILQSQIQQNLPFSPNNGNPRGANNMPQNPGMAPLPGTPLTPQRQTYINSQSGQQGDLGRYRPPTLAGNGNNPMNWNDSGGYAYNLPMAYGPTPQRGPGPYGGYPQYLMPQWRNMLPGGN